MFTYLHTSPIQKPLITSAFSFEESVEESQAEEISVTTSNAEKQLVSINKFPSKLVQRLSNKTKELDEKELKQKREQFRQRELERTENRIYSDHKHQSSLKYSDKNEVGWVNTLYGNKTHSSRKFSPERNRQEEQRYTDSIKKEQSEISSPRSSAQESKRIGARKQQSKVTTQQHSIQREDSTDSMFDYSSESNEYEMSGKSTWSKSMVGRINAEYEEEAQRGKAEKPRQQQYTSPAGKGRKRSVSPQQKTRPHSTTTSNNKKSYQPVTTSTKRKEPLPNNIFKKNAEQSQNKKGAPGFGSNMIRSKNATPPGRTSVSPTQRKLSNPVNPLTANPFERKGSPLQSSSNFFEIYSGKVKSWKGMHVNAYDNTQSSNHSLGLETEFRDTRTMPLNDMSNFGSRRSSSSDRNNSISSVNSDLMKNRDYLQYRINNMLKSLPQQYQVSSELSSSRFKTPEEIRFRRSRELGPTDHLTDAAEWSRMLNWLSKIGMEKYAASFKSGGVTKLSVLELLWNRDLAQLGIDQNDIPYIMECMQEISRKTKSIAEQALTPPTLSSQNSSPSKSRTSKTGMSPLIQSSGNNSRSNSVNPNSKSGTMSKLSLRVLSESSKDAVNTPNNVGILDPIPIQTMMQAFESGDCNTFVMLWSSFVAKALNKLGVGAKGNILFQKTLEAASPLEYYTRLYFAVYPIRRKLAKPVVLEAMNAFKDYLENVATNLELVNSRLFAAYSGIILVPDPTQNPAYSTLFDEKWSASVNSRLVLFLTQLNDTIWKKQTGSAEKLKYENSPSVNIKDENSESLYPPPTHTHSHPVENDMNKVIHTMQASEKLNKALRDTSPGSAAIAAHAAKEYRETVPPEHVTEAVTQHRNSAHKDSMISSGNSIAADIHNNENRIPGPEGFSSPPPSSAKENVKSRNSSGKSRMKVRRMSAMLGSGPAQVLEVSDSDEEDTNHREPPERDNSRQEEESVSSKDDADHHETDVSQSTESQDDRKSVNSTIPIETDKLSNDQERLNDENKSNSKSSQQLAANEETKRVKVKTSSLNPRRTSLPPTFSNFNQEVTVAPVIRASRRHSFITSIAMTTENENRDNSKSSAFESHNTNNSIEAPIAEDNKLDPPPVHDQDISSEKSINLTEVTQDNDMCKGVENMKDPKAAEEIQPDHLYPTVDVEIFNLANQEENISIDEVENALNSSSAVDQNGVNMDEVEDATVTNGNEKIQESQVDFEPVMDDAAQQLPNESAANDFIHEPPSLDPAVNTPENSNLSEITVLSQQEKVDSNETSADDKSTQKKKKKKRGKKSYVEQLKDDLNIPESGNNSPVETGHMHAQSETLDQEVAGSRTQSTENTFDSWVGLEEKENKALTATTFNGREEDSASQATRQKEEDVVLEDGYLLSKVNNLTKKSLFEELDSPEHEITEAVNTNHASNGHNDNNHVGGDTVGEESYSDEISEQLMKIMNANVGSTKSDWELVGNKWVRKNLMSQQQIEAVADLFEKATGRARGMSDVDRKGGRSRSSSTQRASTAVSPAMDNANQSTQANAEGDGDAIDDDKQKKDLQYDHPPEQENEHADARRRLEEESNSFEASIL